MLPKVGDLVYYRSFEARFHGATPDRIDSAVCTRLGLITQTYLNTQGVDCFIVNDVLKGYVESCPYEHVDVVSEDGKSIFVPD